MKEGWECASDHTIIAAKVDTQAKEKVRREINRDKVREWLQEQKDHPEEEPEAEEYVVKVYEELSDKMKTSWMKTRGEKQKVVEKGVEREEKSDMKARKE